MAGVRAGRLLLLVLTLAVTAGCASRSHGGSEQDRALASTPGPEPTLLVIGDSWVTGGTMNAGPTWPHLLDLPTGWQVKTDAMGGSGYLGDEEAMSLTYDGRLDRVLQGPAPSVVIVAMGRNDVDEGPADVAEVAKADLLAIERTWPQAQLVVFSPFSPWVPGVKTVALTDELRRTAESMDLGFVDVSRIIRGRGQLLGKMHPNDRGHALIAEKVTADLRDLGVIPTA